MPFVVTSCASKVQRASGPGRGKPVLDCILACSLAFHAITFESSIFLMKIAQAREALNPLLTLFGGFLACGGRKRGKRQTDRQTHTHKHTDQVL